MKKEKIVERIRQLCGNGKLGEAIELSKALDNNEATYYLGRYNDLHKQLLDGTISDDSYQSSRNKLLRGFLNFIKGWQQSKLIPQEAQGMEDNSTSENELKIEIDFKDVFLNKLEHFLHQQAEYMPGNTRTRVWSLVFLDWQIAQLRRLKAELSPFNFAQLITAIDELEKQTTTLLEIMQQSGNDDSEAHEATLLMHDSQASLRSSLESIDPDDWTLEVGISKLAQSIDDLIYELQEKRATAFQFSSN